LFALGIAAGPLYVVVGLAQILVREGFDVRRHALSLLALGEGGFVQTLNFVVCGALVIAGAIACRGALRPGVGATFGPLLLGLFGAGMVGAAIFPADPAPDFPPGVQPPADLTRDGLLHFVCGGTGFYALIAGCFVFARRLSREGHRGLSRFSVATGAVFFVSFAAVASGSTSPVVMVSFYAANAWVWTWLTVTLLHVSGPAFGLSTRPAGGGAR
jgi:hypothetical protein